VSYKLFDKKEDTYLISKEKKNYLIPRALIKEYTLSSTSQNTHTELAVGQQLTRCRDTRAPFFSPVLHQLSGLYFTSRSWLREAAIT